LLKQWSLSGYAGFFVFQQIVGVQLPEECTNSLQSSFLVADHVFITQFQVLSFWHCLAQGMPCLDIVFPLAGGMIGVIGAKIVAASKHRQSHIAAVADNMDDLCIRPPIQQLGEVQDVIGRFVAPARLALAGCIFLEQPANNVAHVVAPLVNELPCQGFHVKLQTMQVCVEKLRTLGFHCPQHAPHVVGLRQITVLRCVAIEWNKKMRLPCRQGERRVRAKHVLQ